MSWAWNEMVKARRAAKVPRTKWREFEERYFEEHPPICKEDKR
jgi:hypothetical protein